MHFIPLYKKGEVMKRTKVSKGHNNSYSRDIKFAATLALWADWGMFSINAIFSQVQSSLLNDKTHYFVKLKGICPITLKNMAILKFQMGKVCILLNRFNPSSKGTCILSFYTILLNFIKIGQELFEIIGVNIHRQTDTHTDTYTRMKIIPVQNQRFWAK